MSKASVHPPPFPLERLGELQTFRQFDDAITAPLHGFRDVDDYYSRSSSRQYLKDIHVPTLIIHAEHDHIIPHAEGALLFETCPAADKTLITIPAANHNDIFMRGLQDYLAALSQFARGLKTDTTA